MVYPFILRRTKDKVLSDLPPDDVHRRSAERAVVPDVHPDIVEGAKKLGTAEKKAAHLFALMEHFAGYGFNKSHSTAYALLAYQTAYLKANYPWHFAAALQEVAQPAPV